MGAEKLFALLLPLALWPSEGALEMEGERIYMAKGCYGCHGVAGEGVNDFPKLAGKSKGYLAKRLRELKRGVGRTPGRQMMIPFAKRLTEREIVAISAFLCGAGETGDGDRMEIPEEILGGND